MFSDAAKRSNIACKANSQMFDRLARALLRMSIDWQAQGNTSVNKQDSLRDASETLQNNFFVQRKQKCTKGNVLRPDQTMLSQSKRIWIPNENRSQKFHFSLISKACYCEFSSLHFRIFYVKKNLQKIH